MTSALLAFLHHGAAFIIFGVLTAELVLMRSEVTLAAARSLQRLDAAYGLSAAMLIAVGFLRVYYTEKGAAYYFHSLPFIAKLALFAIVGLISIYPTRQFISWRKALGQQQVPALQERTRRTIRTIIHVELTLLLLIMLCAALMARGIGYLG